MGYWDTPYQDQDHKIITATQCFWVANGLTTASTNHLQEYIFKNANLHIVHKYCIVNSPALNLNHTFTFNKAVTW